MSAIQFRNIRAISGLSEIAAHTVKASLNHLKYAQTTETSILFCDDSTMLQLNKAHRNIEAATDVLSFPNESENPESGKVYLGDIAISIERAKAQAESAGHSFENEIQLLLIHGLLHLVGYDHEKAGDKREMWAVQNEILDLLAIQIDKEKIGAY